MSGKIHFSNFLAILDSFIVILVTSLNFYQVLNKPLLICYVLWTTCICLALLHFKKIYKHENNAFIENYKIFEGIVIANILAIIPIFILNINIITILLAIINTLLILLGIYTIRILKFLCSKLQKRTKNVLIVGAGQDGKLIAEEIQSRTHLGMRVVGFLDDNMNTIEDEDSTIPILGLTCDSEAVIKDNNVDIVIIAVKSRMDANILTDLIKGIPLGVKVMRMPIIYEQLTHKYLISKMTVNWLFHACIKKKALLYAHLKRICDVIASLLILILTIPFSIIAMIGIKLSDFGPIIYTQTRIGKFGKPFEMLKFRTMYQDEDSINFDDDLNEVLADDKRIIPFCKWIRKLHIDEIPQLINVLKGDMSVVGPRPVRVEVDYRNSEKIPFWECRNWVRPGWCGWQQLKNIDPTSEERLAYDLYYIRHRNLIWEFIIILQYKFKILCGKG